MCIYIVHIYYKKSWLFYQQNEFIGIVEELQVMTSRCGKPQASPKNRGKGLAFTVEKEEVGRDYFKEFRMVMASHWLSVAVSHYLVVIRSPNLKATS